MKSSFKHQTSFSGRQLYQLTRRPPQSHQTTTSEAGCCLSSSCTGRQDVALAVLCLASSLPGPHCASSLHSNSSTLKMLGKWGWLLVRNVNVGSPDCFWPSQILLRFLREQFVSWLNSSLLQLHLLGNYTFLNCPSSFNSPRCYSLSFKMPWSVTACWQAAVTFHPRSDCMAVAGDSHVSVCITCLYKVLGLENVLGFLGGEQCYISRRMIVCYQIAK